MRRRAALLALFVLAFALAAPGLRALGDGAHACGCPTAACFCPKTGCDSGEGPRLRGCHPAPATADAASPAPLVALTVPRVTLPRPVVSSAKRVAAAGHLLELSRPIEPPPPRLS